MRFMPACSASVYLRQGVGGHGEDRMEASGVFQLRMARVASYRSSGPASDVHQDDLDTSRPEFCTISTASARFSDLHVKPASCRIPGQSPDSVHCTNVSRIRPERTVSPLSLPLYSLIALHQREQAAVQIGHKQRLLQKAVTPRFGRRSSMSAHHRRSG